MHRIFSDNKIKAKNYVVSPDKYLYFARESLPEEPLKVNEATRADYIRKAEEYLETTIPILPLSLYREFVVNGNRSRFDDAFFKRRSMLFVLSMAEAIERKGRFIEKMADVMFAIYEESTWVISAHAREDTTGKGDGVPHIYGGNYTPTLDLFSAVTGANLAIACYFHKSELDKISTTICERAEYEVNERIFKAFLTRREWWTGMLSIKNTNNWTTWIVLNVLTATLFMGNLPKSRVEAILDKAMTCLDNFTANYPVDGGCDEGPAYWGCAGNTYVTCLSVMYDLTGGALNIYDHPFIKDIVEYIAKVHIDGHYYVNFADSRPRIMYSGKDMGVLAEKTDSELLWSFSAYLKSLERNDSEASFSYGPMPYESLSQLNFELNVEPADFCKKDKTTWLHGLKIMVARQSEESNKGLCLAIKGGHNEESHNHNDVGSFIVYDDGKPLFIDIGTETYTKFTFDPKHRYNIWYITSAYHNLPTIGGAVQKNGRAFASTNEAYDKSTQTLSLELKNAYPDDSGINSYVRVASMSSEGIKIVDTLDLENEVTVDFHFMTKDEPEITGNEVKIANRILAFPEGMKAEIETIKTEDRTLIKNWSGCDTFYRITISKSIKQGSVEFMIK